MSGKSRGAALELKRDLHKCWEAADRAARRLESLPDAPQRPAMPSWLFSERERVHYCSLLDHTAEAGDPLARNARDRLRVALEEWHLLLPHLSAPLLLKAAVRDLERVAGPTPDEVPTWEAALVRAIERGRIKPEAEREWRKRLGLPLG